MGEGGNLRKAENVVARLQAQHLVERGGPEDAAAGEVPVEQAAAAAVERQVDARPGGGVDLVGLLGARRLGEEGVDQDQENRSGADEQGHIGRHAGSPIGEDHVLGLDQRDHAEPAIEMMHGGVSLVRLAGGDGQDPGAGAEDGKRLAGSEQIGERTAFQVGADRRGRHDHAVRIGDEDAAAIARCARRQAVGEGGLKCGAEALLGKRGLGRRQARGQRRRDHRQIVARPQVGLFMFVGQRQRPIGRERGDEDDAKNRNGAAEERFRGEQSLIGRLRQKADVPGQRLRVTLSFQHVRESTRGRSPCKGTRHRNGPRCVDFAANRTQPALESFSFESHSRPLSRVPQEKYS